MIVLIDGDKGCIKWDWWSEKAKVKGIYIMYCHSVGTFMGHFHVPKTKRHFGDFIGTLKRIRLRFNLVRRNHIIADLLARIDFGKKMGTGSISWKE